MSYTQDLLNLAMEANGIAAGITANTTSITSISVGNSTVNTSVNTTGFAVNGISIGLLSSRTITADSILLASDSIIQANTTTSLTLTLMDATNVVGKQFYVRNINNANVNVIGNTSSQTINGYSNVVMQFKNSVMGLVSVGSTWIIN